MIMFEVGKPTSFQKEGWVRPITYDGDRTVGVELKTDAEREAVKKISAALDGLGDKEQAAQYLEKLAKMSSSELNLFAESPALARIWFDPTLSTHQRKLQSLPFIQHFRRQGLEKQKEVKRVEGQIEYLQGKLKCAEVAEQWLKSEPKLEKNDCSRLHMLKQAVRENKIILEDDKTLEEETTEKWKPDFSQFHSFVVQHDWGKAFDGATDFDGGEVRLPYENCIFELRISGRTVLICAKPEPSGAVLLLPWVQFDDWWIIGSTPAHFGEPIIDGIFAFAVKEVKAIAVALDAEVASHSVVRAPQKLNKIRENSGKVPLSDYHIVKLAHRERIINPSNGASGVRRRLHFRRGHWRHYAEFKSWVRWTLVGNPELGFVDKEYRL